MALHLIKLAVGIDTLDHLRERQRQRLAEQSGNGRKPRLRILTRNMPRRADEIVGQGGSLFWVIKGYVQVRQTVTGIEQVANGEGKRRCAIPRCAAERCSAPGSATRPTCVASWNARSALESPRGSR